MHQQIIIAEQLRIAALLTDERVDELIVAQGSYQIGDVFLGTVEKPHSARTSECRAKYHMFEGRFSR